MLEITNAVMSVILLGAQSQNKEMYAEWYGFLATFIEHGYEDIDWLKNVIYRFFLPDRINFYKCKANLEFLERGSLAMLESVPTPSILNFEDASLRPSTYPEWFLVAYPDVVFWMSKKTRENKQAFHIEVFGRINADDLFDKNHSFRYQHLRTLIDAYQRSTNELLECC